MKLTTITLLAFALAAIGFAQNQKRWFETPEGYFRNSTHALSTDQLIGRASHLAVRTAVAPRGPGLPLPLAALVTDGDFAFRGEEYAASLVVKADLPQSVYVYGRLLFPGPFGQQSMDSRIEYFSALLGDGSGNFRHGLADGDVVPVFAQRIMSTYNSGDYLLDVIIADSNGNQLFEAYSRFSVTVRSTPTGQSSFRILGARSQYVGFTDRNTRIYDVTLTGRFPQGLPLDITATLPGLPRFDASAVSAEGATLTFRYETPPVFAPSVANLTVYSDFFREAITLRHGLNLDAAIGAPQ